MCSQTEPASRATCLSPGRDLRYSWSAASEEESRCRLITRPSRVLATETIEDLCTSRPTKRSGGMERLRADDRRREACLLRFMRRRYAYHHPIGGAPHPGGS